MATKGSTLLSQRIVMFTGAEDDTLHPNKWNKKMWKPQHSHSSQDGSSLTYCEKQNFHIWHKQRHQWKTKKKYWWEDRRGHTERRREREREMFRNLRTNFFSGYGNLTPAVTTTKGKQNAKCKRTYFSFDANSSPSTGRKCWPDFISSNDETAFCHNWVHTGMTTAFYKTWVHTHRCEDSIL